MNNTTNHIAKPIGIIAALLTTCGLALALPTIDWSTIDGGGGTTSGGPFTIAGTIGQPDPGPPVLTGGSFTITGGFWAVPPPCPGDTNGDNQINGADLSVLLSQFNSAVTPGSGADFNGDGLVNGADLSVLLSRFGTSC